MHDQDSNDRNKNVPNWLEMWDGRSSDGHQQGLVRLERLTLSAVIAELQRYTLALGNIPYENVAMWTLPSNLKIRYEGFFFTLIPHTHVYSVSFPELNVKMYLNRLPIDIDLLADGGYQYDKVAYHGA